MTPTRRAGGLLVLAAASLVVAWLTSSRAVLPIYDGLGLPPEPYRYVHPPPGQKAGLPPSSAQVSIAVSHGQVQFAAVSTREQPPQARLVLLQNSLVIPPGVTRLTITIHPVPPPSTAPNGTIDGNVYRVTATTNTGAAVGVRKNKAEIDLRGTGLRGSPVIEQFNQGRWSRLTTGQFIGVAMYTANISGLGDFALVFAGKATAGGNSSLPYVIIGAAVVVLLLVGLLLARVARGPSTEENSAR